MGISVSKWQRCGAMAAIEDQTRKTDMESSRTCPSESSMSFMLGVLDLELEIRVFVGHERSTSVMCGGKEGGFSKWRILTVYTKRRIF